MEVEDIIIKKHEGDTEQLRFIFSDHKKIIVTAPAGCGKTTAMISKIARELSSKNISSNKKILAMTFSVNAAMKIKDSLKELMPKLTENVEQYLSKVDVANYHNFALRILFKYGYILNSEFIHLSEFEIVNENSDKINRFITSEDDIKLKEVNKAVKNSDKDKLKELWNDYWNILNRKLVPNQIITYNGILISAIQLLRNEEISFFYKQYYQMIIIDEFQDTNLLGYFLIKKLIGNNIVIFLGDDDQKIYGFLGALNNIFNLIVDNYPIIEIKFHNNYRFKNNERMKALDLFIRDYVENFQASELKASVLLKQLENDEEENAFIIQGIERIMTIENNKVAVLVRSGWQANSIIKQLDKKNISYFNALFGESDLECILFYEIALEEFHHIALGKASKKDLKKCLSAIYERRHQIYEQNNRKYIFDSMYKLLEILFTESRKIEGTLKEKYEYIDFVLENKGLKHMMEYIDDRIVLTTIHAAKGLEWDYVIIPKLNGFVFPTSYVCKPCQQIGSCEKGANYCKFTYGQAMEKIFNEALCIFYVAITRAKKEVFLTTNTGRNNKGYYKTTSCLLHLDGLDLEDFEWKNII